MKSEIFEYPNGFPVRPVHPVARLRLIWLRAD